jgi:hypothetical protein
MNGENKNMRLWLSNMGTKPVGEVWLVQGHNDLIWIGKQEEVLAGKFKNHLLVTSR